MQARLTASGLDSADQRDTSCCYARQDKFWVEGTPDGAAWEVYTVLGDSPVFHDHDHGGPGCCGTAASGTGQPTAPGAKCC